MKKALAFTLLISFSSLIAAAAGPGTQLVANPKAKKKAGAMAPIEDDPKLPRVLLIGDSISIGYTLPVRALLKGKANVHRPPTNCASTKQGLAGIDAWLGDGEWDLIHFNWGLHDLKYMKTDSQNLAAPKDATSAPQVPLDQYEKNLAELVARLKKTGAKLVWRNTTPVPVGATGRVPGDSAKYNAVAKKIMDANGIPTQDMFAFATAHAAEIARKKNVHFTPEGSRQLAGQVAEIIEAQLQPGEKR